MTQLFVNKLSIIDFSYFDHHRGIVGESWIVSIELDGDLDDQGMIFDFGQVKKKIKSIIDCELDHRFIISSHVKHFEQKLSERTCTLVWENKTGCYQHQSPEDAIVILDAKTITHRTVAQYLEEIITRILPRNVTKVSLTLADEPCDGAYYHYSHSLKKHDGNCQRIIHGHRSKIEIYENHRRKPALEDYWSACFRDRYIGTRADVELTFEIEGKPHIRFSYKASQGDFSVTLPEETVYLIDTDSTVELIAAHVANECSLKKPNNHYRVKAYEGIDKGAVAVNVAI